MSSYKTLTKSSGISLSAFSIALVAMSASATVSAGVNDSIENALKFGQADAKYGQIKFDLTTVMSRMIVKTLQRKKVMPQQCVYV